MNINELGLSEALLEAVEEMGYVQPTPIQEQAIPFLLGGDRDLIGLAATGTGKTAAFGLPLLQKLDTNKKGIQALILCPTRELCKQIANELENFSKYLRRVEIVSVYGGAPIGKQIQAIRKGAQVIAATPGRIRDLQKRGVADLSKIDLLVLDEADEMLNMGFEEELREILAETPREKQTALFSATLSPRIASIASGYLINPHEISVGQRNQASSTVEHSYYCVHHSDRYTALRMILDYNANFYGIVFCRTRQNTADIADKLVKDGYGAEALHGDVPQNQREVIMGRFKAGVTKILIATDVAARGIDVDNLTHVIHHELPDDSEVYIHRSGRTGRAGKEGISIAVITPNDRRRMPLLERLVKKKIEARELPSFNEIVQKRLSLLAESAAKEGDIGAITSEQMETYAPVFEALDRETLIRALIANSVMPLVAHYQNLQPLKSTVQREPKKGKMGKGVEFNRDRGAHGRQMGPKGHRGAAPGRAHGKPAGHSGGDRSRRSYANDGQYTRFFCSLGRKDGIQPKDIIGFVNQSTGDRNIPIGQIEVKPAFSFFEVDSDFKAVILKKSDGAKFKKHIVKVEQVKR